jgi:fucose permease
MASIFPTAITLAGRRIPITGQITGWFLVGASLGGMSLPWVMGRLFALVGPWSAMAAIFVNLVVALAVLVVLLAFSQGEGSPAAVGRKPKAAA